MVISFNIVVPYHKQDIDIDVGRYRRVPSPQGFLVLPFYSNDFLPLLNP